MAIEQQSCSHPAVAVVRAVRAKANYSLSACRQELEIPHEHLEKPDYVVPVSRRAVEQLADLVLDARHFSDEVRVLFDRLLRLFGLALRLLRFLLPFGELPKEFDSFS